MRSSNVILGIACVLWSIMIWGGINLIQGVTAQHVPGYPTSGQILYDIKFPAMVAITLLVSGLISNFFLPSPRFLKYLSIFALIVLFFYFMSLGAGV